MPKEPVHISKAMAELMASLEPHPRCDFMGCPKCPPLTPEEVSEWTGETPEEVRQWSERSKGVA
jgi:hypothetical protein